VVFGHGAIGQLALLAHRHETQVELIGQHRAQDEPSCIDTGNQVETVTHVAIDEDVDQDTKRTRVLQDGRDVSEGHAGLGPVRHAAYGVADVLGRIDIHGMKQAWRHREKTTVEVYTMPIKIQAWIRTPMSGKANIWLPPIAPSPSKSRPWRPCATVSTRTSSRRSTCC